MANTGSLLRRAGAAEKGPDGRYAAWGARNVSAWRTARRFFQICSGIMAELWASEEVLPFKFASMVSIAAAPGLDQTRLAEELGIDRTNTGQVLDRLEAKGLVERRSDPADRRIRRLFLTARGVALRTRLQAPALAAQDRMLMPLTEDEKISLLRLLMRVVEANEAYARPMAAVRPSCTT